MKASNENINETSTTTHSAKLPKYKKNVKTKQ